MKCSLLMIHFSPWFQNLRERGIQRRKQRTLKLFFLEGICLPRKTCSNIFFFLATQHGGSSPIRDRTHHFHALEKETATHSSVLAWRVAGTGKPGGLPSMGSHRVGHDWSDLAVINFTNLNWNWCQRPQIGTSPEVFKHTWIYIFLQKQKHPQTLSLPLLLISLLGGFGPN